MAVTKYIVTLVLLTYLAQAEGQTVFNTTNGPVRGETINVNGKSLDVLLSIPFAKPPVGNLRFKPPQPADTWTEIREATKLSPACIQPNMSIGITGPNDPRMFEGTYDEDCLYLNIWKPSSAIRSSNLPVMVWIYGGGFNVGNKDIPLFNGQYLSSYDVIVVSMNYRVGLLGFGYLGPDTLPGNLGLLDQVEAMKWVRNNIDNFGGDPDKVTIFGESAGSWSVGLHHFSPLSTTYFQNAIMQSGAPMSSVLELVVYSHDRARGNVQKLAEAMECSGDADIDIYNCLMMASAEKIATVSKTVIEVGVQFYPVVDGNFIRDRPKDLMERGLYKKNKVLIGATKDEASYYYPYVFNMYTNTTYETGEKLSAEFIYGALPYVLMFHDKNKLDALGVFYESLIPNARDNPPQILNEIASDLMFTCPAIMFSSAISPEQDLYFYILNYRVSTIPLPSWTGVPHSYDMDLMFGHPLDPSRTYTDEDKEVSRIMMTYWTNFAKSGSPNSPLSVITNWPMFDPEDQRYLALDSGSNLATRQGPRRHECAFVNGILPLIPSDDDTTVEPPCVYPEGYVSASVKRDVNVAVLLLLLASTFLQ